MSEHGSHHEHEHHHEHGELKEGIIRIVAASILLAVAVIVDKSLNLKAWQALLLFLVPYLTVGYETLHEAFESLAEGEAMDEDFLMSIATIGALAIGFLPGAEPQFAEAVFVMLFFQVGELFEGIAEGRSRRSIAHLMDMRPDSANVERDGKVEVVCPEEVGIGETIVVRPGEKVPMDGIVLEGRSALDTKALTGESLPRAIEEGSEVVSGCVNLSGVLRIRVTKPFGESTASKILELVENAAASKSYSESFITRFAKVYTPVVVILALLLAFVPVLFGGRFSTWLYRALMFLVVSCPCALVISVPLSFFGGIGGASRHGVLVKGANRLEDLSRLGTVVFDKTGTLTEGVFEVAAVHPETVTATELLHMAAHVERRSTHPIAVSLKNAYPDEDDDCIVENVEEIAGHGIRAVVNGHSVCVGNSRMMESLGIGRHDRAEIGTIVHVAIDGRYEGCIVISDRVRADSAKAVADLKAEGVDRLYMLTGDSDDVAREVACKLGLTGYHAGLLPDGKVAHVESLIREQKLGKVLAFVGDGINDAPVLARADLGIAMGGLGSDAAIEAADVVLMDDSPSKIAQAVRIARKTVRIADENTYFAIGVKLLVLLLAAVGMATMWMAVFADVGVTILAVLNAMRTLR